MTDFKVFQKSMGSSVVYFDDFHHNFFYVMKELKSRAQGTEFHKLETQLFVHNMWVYFQKLIKPKDSTSYYNEDDSIRNLIYKVIDRNML